MRVPLLALLLLALWPACISTGEPRPGYTLEATNNHSYDVVVYLVRGSRQRLGRMSPMTDRSWHLTEGEVQSNPQLLVCVGSWTPNNGQCHRTGRIRGHYSGRRGEPGVVFLTIQRGIGGIVAILNG